MKITFIFLTLTVIFLSCMSNTPPTDELGRPFIKKLGTIDCDLVEATPVVFKNTLYRFEYVRPKYKQNDTGDSYFRFVDYKTGQVSDAFAHGYHLGSAFVEGDSLYAIGTDIWDGEKIDMFVTTDMKTWTSWNALNLPGYGLFNTSLCKADSQYVLMFEVGKPPEIAGNRFTARFAVSTDLRNWELTPPECTYTKERYSAPHCLRYLDGYFYNFYLENREGYETRVVRSKDLINWEQSPLNPVLRASQDDKLIANSSLTPQQIEFVVKARNINNSDIDMCEYKGELIISYSWGDQQGTEFLAKAVYQGSLRDFLTGWFPEKM